MKSPLAWIVALLFAAVPFRAALLSGDHVVFAVDTATTQLLLDDRRVDRVSTFVDDHGRIHLATAEGHLDARAQTP